jgi:hypothetical protein
MAIKVFDGSSGAGYSLPTQTGNAGKRLTTNGTTATWQMPGFNLIAKTVATGGNSISFSNIPQTYNHLRVIGSGTIDGTTEVGMRFNNSMDFVSTYHQYGGSSTVNGSSYSSRLGLGNYQSGYGYVFDVNIPNYALINIRKGAAAFVGGSGGNVGYAICGGGTNSNSNPITQLDVYSPSNNFSNFIVCLYGWN